MPKGIQVSDDKDQLEVNEDGSLNIKGKARKAITINEGSEIEATNGITTNNDLTASIVFENDTEPISLKLVGGVVYPYSITKVESGSGIVGLY
jgi:hypothetical protein